jgi:hypothetical protein
LRDADHACDVRQQIAADTLFRKLAQREDER